LPGVPRTPRQASAEDSAPRRYGLVAWETENDSDANAVALARRPDVLSCAIRIKNTRSSLALLSRHSGTARVRRHAERAEETRERNGSELVHRSRPFLTARATDNTNS